MNNDIRNKLSKQKPQVPDRAQGFYFDNLITLKISISAFILYQVIGSNETSLFRLM